jgi:hypothetical protein
MKDPFRVMPHHTAVMYQMLEKQQPLKNFVLIGGTGLALHIGHRQSEDLDFITTLPRLPRALLKQIETAIRQQGHSLVYKDDPASADDFENAGLELHDHSQNWLIDGIVKLTFFAGDDHHRKILTQPNESDGFRVGTLLELSQLKALVAASRSTSRDWLDLFVLERDHKFGLAQWKEAYDKAGLTSAHFENALNRICSGILAPDDQGFSSLMGCPPSLGHIASHFQTLRRDYETNIARAAFGAD